MFLLYNDLVLNGLIVVLALEFVIFEKDLEKFKFNSGPEAINKLVDRHNKLFEISKTRSNLRSPFPT